MHSTQTSYDKYSFRRPHILGFAILILCAVVLFSTIISVHERTWVVAVDEEPVAQVSQYQDIDEALSQLDIPEGYQGRVKAYWAQEQHSAVPFVSSEDLHMHLAEALGHAQEAVALRIDGKRALVFRDAQDAERFLDFIQDYYKVEEGAETSFAEEVELVTVRALQGDIVDLTEAKELARETVENVEKYTIAEGDTIWDVAQHHQLTENCILQANPQLNKNSILQVGKQLVITREKPLLTVVTRAQVVEEREVPYQTTVRRDPNVQAGQRKVLEPGSPGLEKVTLEVVRQNGKLVAQNPVEVQRLKEPQTRVEASGSKIVLAARAGSGQLAWPTRGRIISGFGPRSGRMHTGIDISAPTGQQVVAAEGGSVIRASYYGGYGYCVDISHGNGVVTRYAHLSRMAVSVGQEVQRGQNVGSVGSTGNSTGPHLHFEVIINGAPRNPVNYL